MFRFPGRAVAGLFALLILASPVHAQNTTTIRTRSQGPSAADLKLYGLNSFDRPTYGARALGMGGAGLALSGQSSSGFMNPASLGFLTRPVLGSESRYRSGGASAERFPAGLMAGGLGVLPISNYRPGITSSYGYADLALGTPILFLGRRAGLGFGYRRLIDFRGGEESRYTLQSPFGPAEFGQGSAFNGGVDALTPTFAINVSPRISVGASLNFIGGTLTENGNQGVATFGQVVARGAYYFQQDTFGTSTDLGVQYRVSDRLSLGGVIQPGYDLEFKNGEESYQGLPDPTSQMQVLLIQERDIIDHSLSVPTQFGAGMAYTLFDSRGTLAVDYWNRAWSKARIKQEDYNTTLLFADSTNLISYVPVITPNGNFVENDPKLSDTHHFRFGFEYMLVGHQNESGIKLPIRFGFRREPLTFRNTVDSLGYNQLRQEIILAAIAGSGTEQGKAEVTRLVDRLYHEGAGLLAGDEVNSTVLTVGTGIQVGAFQADLAFSRQSYTVDRVFQGAFADFVRDPGVLMVREKRGLNRFSFSTSLRF